MGIFFPSAVFSVARKSLKRCIQVWNSSYFAPPGKIFFTTVESVTSHAVPSGNFCPAFPPPSMVVRGFRGCQLRVMIPPRW